MSATAEVSAQPAAPQAGGALRRAWHRAPRGFLGLVMLFTGAAGLIYEYVLSTVFTYQLGSSIEQFSVTIGVMFVAMGIGGLMQPKLRGPLALYFILAELLLVLLGGFAPIALQWAFAEMPTNFGLIKFIYPGLIGLLIGVEIPLAMRINEQFQKNLSKNIASTWAWDYIGGALGVVVWIWMLHHYIPITHISFWVAGANLLVAVMSLVFFWSKGLLPRRSSRVFTLVTILGVVFAMLFGASNVDAWGKLINQKLYDNPIVFHETTKYQDIVMTEGIHPNNPLDKNYELFLNGNKQFSSVDEKIYHEHLVHPAMNLAAAHGRVLVLGGGDGLAVRELLKYKDVTSITLVDLDPEMIKLASTNPIMRKLNGNSFGDARVHSTVSPGVNDTGAKTDVRVDTGETAQVECDDAPDEGDTVTGCYSRPVTEKVASVDVYTIDADRFVSAPRELFDVVIVDLPDPNSIELAKLYSKEFYEKIRRSMSPDGMMVVQATSPYHAKETFLCIMRTMAAAGFSTVPYHTNVPSFGDWGWVLASPTQRPEALYDRMENLKTYGVPTTELTSRSMSAALTFNKSQLTTKNDGISTLMNPVIYGLYTYEAWKVD
jgi:spermidine synthase